MATLAALLAAASSPPSTAAHDGPPFPVVEGRVVASYRVSVWTDPDATDDGKAGGQFWIVVHAADGTPVRGDVTATLTARPRQGAGAPRTASGRPSPNDRSVLFAAVVMDHEGPWRVEVTLDGALGQAALETAVDATYDTRPPPLMLAVYALPFAAVAFLWLKAIRNRRRFARPPS